MAKAAAAKRIGVHFVTLYAWENERRADQPSDDNFSRAARVYRTSAAKLKQRAAEIRRTLEAEGTTIAVEPQAAGARHQGGASSVPKRRPRAPTRPRQRQADIGRATTPSPADLAALAPARTQSPAAASGSSFPRGPLPHGAYVRALRVLADIAEQTALPPESLAAAHRALTAPELLQLFAAVNQGPLTDDDIFAAVESAGVAMRSYVIARHGARAPA